MYIQCTSPRQGERTNIGPASEANPLPIDFRPLFIFGSSAQNRGMLSGRYWGNLIPWLSAEHDAATGPEHPTDAKTEGNFRTRHLRRSAVA